MTPPWFEVLKAADAPLVALVLGYMLWWALKQVEKKDAVIVDIATRSSKALEAALARSADS